MKESINKILVMGGSFNPPTTAHLRLMEVAMAKLNADRGLFVPVSDAYLRRKMRNSHPPLVLSPEMRIEMLGTMCDDPRMEVCESEIGTVRPNTLATLDSIREENPDAEIYFIMGSDKLKLLTMMTEGGGFLDRFNVVIFGRDNEPIDQILVENELLPRYTDRITLLPQTDDIFAVSSSEVRSRMLSGKEYRNMLTQGVWQLFSKFSPDDFPDVINKFDGEYSFLSNRFACKFIWEGISFTNVVAALQASKSADRSYRLTLSSLSADTAATKGSRIEPYPDWEENRIAIMETIIRAKFYQNPTLMKRLRDTTGLTLINGNNKGEIFWGVDLYSWRGENHLGKLLMKIRDNA